MPLPRFKKCHMYSYEEEKARQESLDAWNSCTRGTRICEQEKAWST